jgi:hypothetical protein
MNRVHSLCNGLVETTIDRDFQPYTVIQTSVTLDLGRLDKTLKSNVMLNLRRGHCSSVGGKAFKIYRVLSAHFDIPLFSIGRADQVIVSLNNPTPEQTDEFCSRFQAVWNVGRKPETNPWRHSTFYPHKTHGHAPGWITLWMPRPPALNMAGVCNLLGIKDIWGIVPNANTLQAQSAILRGESLVIQAVSNPK